MKRRDTDDEDMHENRNLGNGIAANNCNENDDEKYCFSKNINNGEGKHDNLKISISNQITLYIPTQLECHSIYITILDY